MRVYVLLFSSFCVALHVIRLGATLYLCYTQKAYKKKITGGRAYTYMRTHAYTIIRKM